MPVYVIACEDHVGYEPDSVKPILLTHVLTHLGYWDNLNSAALKVCDLNARDLPEDDSPTSDKYFVLELDHNEKVV